MEIPKIGLSIRGVWLSLVSGLVDVIELTPGCALEIGIALLIFCLEVVKLDVKVLLLLCST